MRELENVGEALDLALRIQSTMGNSDELLTLVMGCRFNPTRMCPVTRRSEVKAFREEEHDRHIIFV